MKTTRRSFIKKCSVALFGTSVPLAKVKTAPKKQMVHWSGWHCPTLEPGSPGSVCPLVPVDIAIEWAAFTTCPTCKAEIELWKKQRMFGGGRAGKTEWLEVRVKTTVSENAQSLIIN